jgi:hypothetical protein
MLPLLFVLASISAASSKSVWLAGRETAVSEQPPEWDPKGYVIAFACQGRFGNQMDYLLGTMDYATQVDRTLILPPWVDYNAKKTTGKYPWFPWFKEYFNVDKLAKYHRSDPSFIYQLWIHAALKHCVCMGWVAIESSTCPISSIIFGRGGSRPG